jgi:predicted NUDIX family NTP pyrophosphohydrolase
MLLCKTKNADQMKKSAGILIYRIHKDQPEFLLVHPGGPYWAKKNIASWSIPKGEFDKPENAFDAAKRELEEETGLKPTGQFIELTPVKQKSGKLIYAWAIEWNCNPAEIKSNSFEIEWPPHSGMHQSFPEVDKAEWCSLETAKMYITKGQLPFLIEFLKHWQENNR